MTSVAARRLAGWQIARLDRDGLTNSRIGGQLFRSPRAQLPAAIGATPAIAATTPALWWCSAARQERRLRHRDADLGLRSCDNDAARSAAGQPASGARRGGGRGACGAAGAAGSRLAGSLSRQACACRGCRAVVAGRARFERSREPPQRVERGPRGSRAGGRSRAGEPRDGRARRRGRVGRPTSVRANRSHPGDWKTRWRSAAERCSKGLTRSGCSSCAPGMRPRAPAPRSSWFARRRTRANHAPRCSGRAAWRRGSRWTKRLSES